MDWRFMTRCWLVSLTMLFNIKPLVISQFEMPLPMPMPFPMMGMPMMPPPPPPPRLPPPRPPPPLMPVPNGNVVPLVLNQKPMAKEIPDYPTNNGDVALAIPIPVPSPMQIAVPGLPFPSFCGKNTGNPPCPPCPPCVCGPSCTPSFFSYCSPCHQKCRCRPGDDIPEPLPAIPPQIAPGPAFPMPLPPESFGMPMSFGVPVPPMPPMPHRVPIHKQNMFPRYETSCESDTDYSSDTGTDTGTDTDGSSYESDDGKRFRARGALNRGKLRNRQSHRHIKRRPGRLLGQNRNDKIKHLSSRRNSARVHKHKKSDQTIVRPVLSFVDKRGHIKLKKSLSFDDADVLINNQMSEEIVRNKNSVQNIKAFSMTDNESEHKTISNDENEIEPVQQISTNQDIEIKPSQLSQRGKKKLLFKTPNNQRITNLSVSFQVA